MDELAKIKEKNFSALAYGLEERALHVVFFCKSGRHRAQALGRIISEILKQKHLQFLCQGKRLFLEPCPF